jgi:hypothetical protein
MMNIFFWVLGLLAYFFGAGVFLGAKSAIHENVGLMFFLIGSVFVVGAGILSAINKNFEALLNKSTNHETALNDAKPE